MMFCFSYLLSKVLFDITTEKISFRQSDWPSVKDFLSFITALGGDCDLSEEVNHTLIP